ncbi:MAG TPA: dCTP deaminase, partial [Methanococcaceae archaeon]|nr:dCTP deaminase [Methanococcaceae archaeon]
MILSDRDILHCIEVGEISIEPFNLDFLGPCSYDVTLGDEFIVYKDEVYDLRRELNHEKFKIKRAIMVCPLGYKLDEDKIEYYREKYKVDMVINRGILGTTREYIELSNNICAQYQGRSSF